MIILVLSEIVSFWTEMRVSCLFFRRKCFKTPKGKKLLCVFQYEAQNGFRQNFSCFTYLTKKVTSVYSELISEVANFSHITVVLGYFHENDTKHQISYELHNMAHFEVQNCFRQDKNV